MAGRVSRLIAGVCRCDLSQPGDCWRPSGCGCLRVGNDYYLVHTTDHYSPGLLIWHSRDLVHWQAAGAALDAYYGAVWAPFLCEYRGLFYIYYPCDGRIFVVHATHPLGAMEQARVLRSSWDRSHTRCDPGRPPCFFIWPEEAWRSSRTMASP